MDSNACPLPCWVGVIQTKESLSPQVVAPMLQTFLRLTPPFLLWGWARCCTAGTASSKSYDISLRGRIVCCVQSFCFPPLKAKYIASAAEEIISMCLAYLRFSCTIALVEGEFTLLSVLPGKARFTGRLFPIVMGNGNNGNGIIWDRWFNA